MDGNRCPECQNDVSDSITATIVGMISAGQRGPASMTCPHCATELNITANVTATVSRQN